MVRMSLILFVFLLPFIQTHPSKKMYTTYCGNGKVKVLVANLIVVYHMLEKDTDTMVVMMVL